MQQVGIAKENDTKLTSNRGEAVTLWSSPWVWSVAATAVLGVFYYSYQYFATPESMEQRPDEYPWYSPRNWWFGQKGYDHESTSSLGYAYVETKETSDKNGNFMTQIVNQFTKQPDVSTLDDDPDPTCIWEYWNDSEENKPVETPTDPTPDEPTYFGPHLPEEGTSFYEDWKNAIMGEPVETPTDPTPELAAPAAQEQSTMADHPNASFLNALS